MTSLCAVRIISIVCAVIKLFAFVPGSEKPSPWRLLQISLRDVRHVCAVRLPSCHLVVSYVTTIEKGMKVSS
jgi:hypothetical protein